MKTTATQDRSTELEPSPRPRPKYNPRIQVKKVKPELRTQPSSRNDTGKKPIADSPQSGAIPTPRSSETKQKLNDVPLKIARIMRRIRERAGFLEHYSQDVAVEKPVLSEILLEMRGLIVGAINELEADRVVTSDIYREFTGTFGERNG